MPSDKFNLGTSWSLTPRPETVKTGEIMTSGFLPKTKFENGADDAKVPSPDPKVMI